MIDLLTSGLLESKPSLTISELKADLGSLYRGVLYLQQQFSFDTDLPKRLVFKPETIGGVAEQATAYDRLKAYGTVDKRNPQRVLQSMDLLLNPTQFISRKVADFTGTIDHVDLVERLAKEKGKTAADYFEERTEALVGSVPGTRIFELLKHNRPELILPLLSQGKGLYAATTTKSVSIGMLASYIDQYPELATLNKLRGDKQPSSQFFETPLAYQQNFVTFLESVNVKDIPFTLAIDTMNRYDASGKKGWSPSEGTGAEKAVIDFFEPMNYYDSTYSNAKNLGGMSTSQNSMRIFENRLMAKEAAGLPVFTHEMTHSNDEEGLFGGTYQNSGRRQGQGAELYARGLFEVIDNTQNQKANEFVPVFNLNTAIAIAPSDNRVQARSPHTSKTELENYMKNMMDLVAYLEAKEAEVALKVLSADDQAIYYNLVQQVSPELRNGQADTNRIKNQSTNDRFTPYGVLGGADYKASKTVSDLVDQAAVSGQFIPRGVTPFIRNLDTNQYDNVPLLESFYAANVAKDGMNTVGDISFKRNAYEILGWQGWDAFVDYLSNHHASDAEAFKAILADDTEKTWSDFKKAQYNRVSEMMAKDNLWQTEDLLKRLETAITEDLALIKELKNATASIWNGTSQTARDSDSASLINFAKRATNVRQVKLDILRKALNYNELKDTVLVKQKADSEKGNGLVQEMKPEFPIASTKGSGLTQEAKSSIDLTLSKGTGLRQEEKPEFPIANTKGSGLTQEAKSSLDLILSKGTGLRQEEKPEFPIANTKGSGLTQEAKPSIDLTLSKGTGLRQKTKPELLIESLTKPQADQILVTVTQHSGKVVSSEISTEVTSTKNMIAQKTLPQTGEKSNLLAILGWLMVSLINLFMIFNKDKVKNRQ